MRSNQRCAAGMAVYRLVFQVLVYTGGIHCGIHCLLLEQGGFKALGPGRRWRGA
jgi:hypothetical protein